MCMCYSWYLVVGTCRAVAVKLLQEQDPSLYDSC